MCNLPSKGEGGGGSQTYTPGRYPGRTSGGEKFIFAILFYFDREFTLKVLYLACMFITPFLDCFTLKSENRAANNDCIKPTRFAKIQHKVH